MKRKFKIIFAIVFVMAMLFAFAISSSAEGLVFEDGFDNSSDIQYYVVDIPWDSSSIIAIVSTYDEIVAIDPLIFQEFCSGQGIKNYDDFYAYFEAEVQLYGDSIPDIFYSSMLGLSSDEFSYYYNYSVINESDLNEKYQEGKEAGVEEYKISTEYVNVLQSEYDEGYAQGEIDGVTEYKESEEYVIILDSKYSIGKTDGVTEYKESEEYASVLLTKYNDGFVAGTAEGALAYAKSEAYKTALAEEYDKGYDDGFVDGEAQIDVAPIIGFVVVLGLAIGALVVVKFIQKRKLR